MKNDTYVKPKQYEIKKLYLANALSYLGLRYWKNGSGEDVTYNFDDTEEFRLALTELTKLKNKLNV